MALCHWNQVVTSPIASASAKNGTLRATSFHEIRSRRHQAHSSSTNGRTTTDPFASSARRKNASDRTYRPLSAALVVIEEGPEREEIQRERERILAFGDPGRRERRHRMHREERRAQPRAGNAQLPQDPPQQHGGAGVQQDVHDVVPDRVHSPRLPFRPEHGRGEREVILRFGGQPKVVQAVRVLDQRVVNEEAVVVPHEAAAQRRHVGRQRDRHDGQSQGDRLPSPDSRFPLNDRRVLRRPLVARGDVGRWTLDVRCSSLFSRSLTQQIESGALSLSPRSCQ